MEIKTKFTTGERAFFLNKNVGYIYECEIHTVKATMSKDFGTLIRYGIYYYDCETMKAESTSYNSAMEMAKWKDEEHNECKKDILTLVNLIPCNEGNESIINDIKNILK